MNKEKTSVIISGGVGKHISFSALLPQLKEKYGDIILVSAYPMVFYNNPNVYRNLMSNHPYLYEDYLKDSVRFKVEPYETNEYSNDKMHLLDVYGKLLNIEKPSHKPELFTTKQEDAEAMGYIVNVLKTPFILMQISGGTSLYTPDNPNKISFSRDYPLELAQDLVYKIRAKYPTLAVIQIGFKSEPLLKDVINMTNLPVRAIFPLMKYCKTFISIDSFLQHVSAAYDKKGIVLWGGTDPKKLGYEHNVNLENLQLAKCKEIHCHRPDTFFFDQESLRTWTCPFDYECMNFKSDVIMPEFDKIMEQQEPK